MNLSLSVSSRLIGPFSWLLPIQATKGDFGDSLDSALRDRLISGIYNASLEEKFLLLEDRTFLAAMKLCMQEAVEVAQPAMNNSRLKNWRNCDFRESMCMRQHLLLYCHFIPRTVRNVLHSRTLVVNHANGRTRIRNVFQKT